MLRAHALENHVLRRHWVGAARERGPQTRKVKLGKWTDFWILARKISVSDQGRSPTNLLKIFGRLRRPIFLGPNTQKLRSIRTSGRSWKSSLITRIQCWSLFKIEVLTESLFIIFSLMGFLMLFITWALFRWWEMAAPFQNPWRTVRVSAKGEQVLKPPVALKITSHESDKTQPEVCGAAWSSHKE